MTVGQLDEFKSTIEFVVNGKNILCPKFAYVNGELRSEFYDIETGDNIKMENYYTVKQLFEFLDYDITNYNVYVNNEIASDDTKVYENFSVKTDAVTENNPLKRGYTTGDVLNEDDESEANENDEKLQNNEATEDNSDNTEIDNTENSNENDSENVSDNKDKADDNSNNQDNSQEANKKGIVILVNREPVRLKGKSSYILVDLFDFYDFDLSKPKGNVVLKLNGVSCNYMSHIKDGDLVDLYWEEVK